MSGERSLLTASSTHNRRYNGQSGMDWTSQEPPLRMSRLDGACKLYEPVGSSYTISLPLLSYPPSLSLSLSLSQLNLKMTMNPCLVLVTITKLPLAATHRLLKENIAPFLYRFQAHLSTLKVEKVLPLFLQYLNMCMRLIQNK